MVIKTFTAGNGTRIEVDDEFIAGVPEEEMKERKQRVFEVAREVAVNNELRRHAAEYEIHEKALQ